MRKYGLVSRNSRKWFGWTIFRHTKSRLHWKTRL